MNPTHVIFPVVEPRKKIHITSPQFAHLKKEAEKDNIKVSWRLIDGFPYVIVVKHAYATFHGALGAIHAYQAAIVPEARP